MDAALLLQYLVIAMVVLVSAWIVLRSQLPATARRLRVAVALLLLREGAPDWLKALGRRKGRQLRGLQRLRLMLEAALAVRRGRFDADLEAA